MGTTDKPTILNGRETLDLIKNLSGGKIEAKVKEGHGVFLSASIHGIAEYQQMGGGRNGTNQNLGIRIRPEMHRRIVDGARAKISKELGFDVEIKSATSSEDFFNNIKRKDNYGLSNKWLLSIHTVNHISMERENVERHVHWMLALMLDLKAKGIN